MSLRRLKTRKKPASRRILLFGVVLIAGGIYALSLTAAPFIVPVDSRTIELALTKPAVVEQNRFYVPKMGIAVPINEIKNGNETQALLDGAAHRAPESGNPKDGGNFVLAAHRFTFGITPRNVVKQSPFFHIDRLAVGDKLYVDWGGIRYTYQVDRISNVPPTATDIERRTAKPQLTMYSCGLGGERDNRVVIIATQIN